MKKDTLLSTFDSFKDSIVEGDSYVGGKYTIVTDYTPMGDTIPARVDGYYPDKGGTDSTGGGPALIHQIDNVRIDKVTGVVTVIPPSSGRKKF